MGLLPPLHGKSRSDLFAHGLVFTLRFLSLCPTIRHDIWQKSRKGFLCGKLSRPPWWAGRNN